MSQLDELGDGLIFTDLNADALNQCRSGGVGQGVRSSADALPFRDESFDLICLFDVLEHVEDDSGVLSEVFRLLRPEGHLLISVPAHAWLFSRNDEIAGHHRRYNRRDLQGLFKAAGLDLVRCSYANTLLFPAIAIFLLLARGLTALGLSARDSERTNLSWRVPAPIENLLYLAFTSELVLSRHWDLPLGHSIVAIARRQELGARLVTLRPQLPTEIRARSARVSPTALASD